RQTHIGENLGSLLLDLPVDAGAHNRIRGHRTAPDVRDYNVATHHHSCHWRTFSRGLGREDLLALYRVLKPSSGDARYSPKTPSRPGLESRCCRIGRLARGTLLAPAAT